MKIEDGQCTRCGALIHLVVEAGMRWTANPRPLEAAEAVDALLGGRELYRVTLIGQTYRNLSTASPAVLRALLGEPGERPIVVASHECPPAASQRLADRPAAQETRTTPQAPCAPVESVLGASGPPGSCWRCGPAPF